MILFSHISSFLSPVNPKRKNKDNVVVLQRQWKEVHVDRLF